MNIRTATINDAKTVLQMCREHSRESFPDYVPFDMDVAYETYMMGYDNIFIVENNSGAIGYFILQQENYITNRNSFLSCEAIYLKKDFRSLKLVKQIIDFIRDAGKALGCLQVFIGKRNKSKALNFSEYVDVSEAGGLENV